MELISRGKIYVLLETEEERKKKKILRYFCPKRKNEMVYSLWTWRVGEMWKGNYALKPVSLNFILSFSARELKFIIKYIWYRWEDVRDTHHRVDLCVQSKSHFSYLAVESTKDVTSPCSPSPFLCPETPTSPEKHQQ